MDSSPFFAYARKREQIRRMRLSGAEAPWTYDPVLSTYRFCNVFREHDKVTTWFRQNLRDEQRDEHFVLMSTIAFRWFNLIHTGESLLPLLKAYRWNNQDAKELIFRRAPSGPWITGAYMIKSPAGMNKVEGLCHCIGNFAPAWEEIAAAAVRAPGLATLEWMWNELRQFPYMGDFMAYEVVTDLRHTSLLEHAPDINTWANPGPGAARGLCRLNGWELTALNRNREKDRALMIAQMQKLLEHSRTESNWPAAWGKWEMREVEHTLCEFDKYERARLGEGRPKQHFKPS